MSLSYDPSGMHLSPSTVEDMHCPCLEPNRRELPHISLHASLNRLCISPGRRVSRYSSSLRCLSLSTILHSNLCPDPEKGRPHLRGRTIALRRGTITSVDKSPLPRPDCASPLSLAASNHTSLSPRQTNPLSPSPDCATLHHPQPTTLRCNQRCLPPPMPRNLHRKTKMPPVYFFGTLMHVGF
ncbi:hypothetical protein MRB53_011723 [Persea americana]|uniref:Uncharacterized protein n=1 Tax=Persea americana TaxID=3435 RepID=A0ACC2LVQ4_PERAE|nr:hypothetical protein MRB53_011723 [Persea americana]